MRDQADAQMDRIKEAPAGRMCRPRRSGAPAPPSSSSERRATAPRCSARRPRSRRSRPSSAPACRAPSLIVSDTLAGMVPKNVQRFRNLARLEQFEDLVQSVGNQLKRIPGIRPDTFKVRVFSEREFEAVVKATERHFLK